MEENELRLLLQLSLHPEAVATLQPLRDFSENGRDRKIQTELDLGGRGRRVEIKRYWHELFQEIWAAKGISLQDIEECVCKAPLVSLGSPGKSGSTIFLSNAREFVIKTLPTDELRYFCARFEAYHRHIVSNSKSFLPTFLGLFRLKARGRRIYVMISNVVYPADVAIERIYDLKGSTVGRHATEEEKTADVCVFKDNDFLSEGRPVQMGSKQAEVLAVVEQDARFLSDLNIMDYSLLLVYTKPPSSDAQPTTPSSLTASHALWNTHQYSGTLVYFGIIDVFCAYSVKKRVARTFKVLTGQSPSGMSTVPADAYAERFVQFMREHVFL